MTIPSTSFLSSNSHYNTPEGGGGGGYYDEQDESEDYSNRIDPNSNMYNNNTGNGEIPYGSQQPPPLPPTSSPSNENGGMATDSFASSYPTNQTTPNPLFNNNNNSNMDPRITSLPRILLMGPRRAGKTSIQRVVFQKISPHETLFRLEATQSLERTIVDHTPLCRFTIWDFPGDYYGGGMSSMGGGGSSGFGGGSGRMGGQQQQQHEGEYYGGGGENYQAHEYNYQIGGNMNQNQDHPQDHNGPIGNDMNEYTQHDVTGGGRTPSPTMMQPPPSQPTDETNNNNMITNSDHFIYSNANALIFVMDAQDEPYDHVLQNFIHTISRAYESNPTMAIEVFINKVDGELFLSDEAKYDCRRDIMQQVSDELHDAGFGDSVTVNYHLTSIYDHSIFEALSRVVQKLIPSLQPTLENILNVLVSSCGMEKAYLFDVASKLYISTDSSPVDMQSVELCSDMIDVVLDVSGIYGTPAAIEDEEEEEVVVVEDNVVNHEEQQQLLQLSPSHSTSAVGIGNEHESHNDAVPDRISLMTDNAIEPDPFMEDEEPFLHDGNEDYPNNSHTNQQHQQQQQHEEENDNLEEEEQVTESAYDEKSSSVIRLSNGMVLYLKEVDTMLALVCLTRSENFKKKSLIDFNISRLKRALKMLCTHPPLMDQTSHHGGSGQSQHVVGDGGAPSSFGF